MSIVTFWNSDREQSGRTLTSVAVATKMAIERNYKILLLSTSFGDSTMKRCFIGNQVQKNLKLFGGKNNNIAVENGIEGLSKLVMSNKLTPSVITDYTKVIFKGRLEVITGYIGEKDKTIEENITDYRKMEECYVELIKMADQYYDMIIVDLDKFIHTHVREDILRISNVNVYTFQQKLSSLDTYNELKEVNENVRGPKVIPVIARYNNKTKYNIKNITKYIEAKKDLHIIPYNQLFYEAAEESEVVDLFLKLRNLKDKTDDNYIFVDSVKNLTDDIIKKLQDLQKKMR